MTRDVRDSLLSIERNTKSTAASASSAAQQGAITARAAQSAATGAWVGAGFQAVSALQNARAARAAEENLAMQRAMAEQAELHQFAMWRQTPDGAAFTSWRDQAVDVAQVIRGRRSEWVQAWAQVIIRFQAETAESEKHRFTTHAALVRQKGLLVASLVGFILAPIALITAFDLALKPVPGVIADLALLASVILLIGAIALIVVRGHRRRVALRDPRLADEAAARTARYGFDPLAVTPGWEGFAWNATGSAQAESYADAIMHLALTGHHTYPARHQLIPLHIPETTPTQPYYPEELNETLIRFRPPAARA